VYLTFGDLDVQIDDNFIDLIPGEIIHIMVRSSASLAEVKKNLRVTSLVDAFDPLAPAADSARSGK
jgi:hypothetical protein